MSDWTVLLFLSPLILIILGAVIVLVVALCRVTPADVPTVMATACSILCRLADRLPYNLQRQGLLDSYREQGDAGLVSGEDVDQ